MKKILKSTWKCGRDYELLEHKQGSTVFYEVTENYDHEETVIETTNKEKAERIYNQVSSRSLSY